MTPIVNYYNNLAKDYDGDRFNNTYGKFIDEQERKILNKLLVDEHGKVLDLACGSGRLTNYATYGLDASSEMVKIATEKYPNKKIILSDAENIPFENETFDVIICFHFFMHVDKNKMENILVECCRVLKKGGKIIFDIPSKDRRNLLHYKPDNWHGAFSISIKELSNHHLFKLKKTYGLLFFPVHRLPKSIRHFFTTLDYVLANSFLKKWSSYLVMEFEKK